MICAAAAAAVHALRGCLPPEMSSAKINCLSPHAGWHSNLPQLTEPHLRMNPTCRLLTGRVLRSIRGCARLRTLLEVPYKFIILPVMKLCQEPPARSCAHP